MGSIVGLQLHRDICPHDVKSNQDGLFFGPRWLGSESVVENHDVAKGRLYSATLSHVTLVGQVRTTVSQLGGAQNVLTRRFELAPTENLSADSHT